MTSFGTVFAVGSFVVVLGLTATANGQIQNQFDSQLSTQVSVHLSTNGDWGYEGPLFPPDSDSRVKQIVGVTASGVSWDVNNISSIEVSKIAPGVTIDPAAQFTVIASTPGLWHLSKPALVSGRLFDEALSSAPVAVVGLAAAKSLGFDQAGPPNTLFLNGVQFSVIGIFGSSSGLSTPSSAIIIPATVAQQDFGLPGPAAAMTVQTRVGASQVVAQQLAVAIDAHHPGNYLAVFPHVSRSLQNQVTQSVESLILVLAIFFMLAGIAGIANSSLAAFLTRVPEIALKRSLGALPRHIALQFVVEFAIIGAFGGMLGGCLGTAIVLIVAAIAHWTAIVAPWVIVIAPFLGATTGLLASLYSAIRATRIEPIEAFRR